MEVDGHYGTLALSSIYGQKHRLALRIDVNNG